MDKTKDISTETKTEKAIDVLIARSDGVMRKPLTGLKEHYGLSHKNASACDIGSLLEGLIFLGDELRVIRDIAKAANELGLVTEQDSKRFFKELHNIMETTAIVELEDIVQDNCNCRSI